MNDQKPPVDDLSGFAAIPRWIQRSETVTWQAKLVYLALSSRTDRTGAAWPSHRTIAKEAGCSLSSVKTALNELRSLGVVDWSQRVRDDAGLTSNVYRISVVEPVDNSLLPPSQLVARGSQNEAPLATTRLPPSHVVASNERQLNEDNGSVLQSPSSGPVDNSQSDDRPIPHPSAMTAGIDRAALAASVGHIFADIGITDDQLHGIGLEILARAKVHVVDPTRYVVAAIRNDVFEWQAYAWNLETEARALGGNPW